MGQGRARPGGDPQPVVLFDWGETLMWVPGMIHDPDRHLACVDTIFAAHIGPHLGGAPMPSTAFIDHYHAACRTQIAASKQSHREHTFDDRFAMAFELAGAKPLSDPATYRSMSDALGRQVALGARLLEHAAEVIPELAQSYRLGVLSNYPHGPVVAASLERFGLRKHFEAIVVSSDTGWMKPHAGCYQPALDAMQAPTGRTLMVGDDLRNDILGAKALGLYTAWIAPGAKTADPAVDIHLQSLAELPAHCARLFA